MKTKTEFQDTMSYEDAIKAAFPKSLIKRVDNFDDVAFGWEICPEPGHLIVFKVLMNDEMRITVEKFILSHYTGQTQIGKIFSGAIPPNEDYEPDHNFITQLLKNYLSIA